VLAVVLAAGFLAALLAVALLVTRAQAEAEHSAQQRFTERAQISAALTQSVFSALGASSGQELQRRYAGSPQQLSILLRRQFRISRVEYSAVVDKAGRVLASAGRLPRRLALPGFASGAPGLSNVIEIGRARVVEFVIPFGSGAQRRAVVQGIPLRFMSEFLDGYLARVRNVDGAGVALTDRYGTVLTLKGRIRLDGRVSGDRVSATAAVPGTSWHLRLEADRARVMADINDLRWLPWLLLGALALAGLTGMRLYSRMITSMRHQRESNSALHESRDQLRTLVEALEEAVVLHHADGRTELLNESAKTMAETDLDVIDGLREGWEVLDVSGHVVAPGETPVERALKTGLPQTQTIGLQSPDGPRRWMTIRARPLFREGEPQPHAVVGSCMDVTEQRETEMHLTDLAQRDSLTGLWNRRRFEDDLAEQLSRCRRYGEKAALVLLDIDGFKQVNDTCGHLAGDEVLRALAAGLTTRLRASDCAARIGGDEFGTLLVGVGPERAAAVAAEVAARLTVYAREQLEVPIDVTVSVGVAVLDESTNTVAEAFAAADQAMYADKSRAELVLAKVEPAPVPASGSQSPNGRDAERLSSLRALLAAVQARDSYTASHSRQVVTLARAVARRLDLEDDQVREVENAALLHDLGKIGIPDAILRKRGPLNAHEEAVMRQHPVVGEQMVASIPELASLAPAIRAEHERWDGAGYPDGLAGEEIPLCSRIAFVCDAYHAMTSERPYRAALSGEQAIAEIEREAGRQFCPSAAEALLGVLRERAAPKMPPAAAIAG
jgi:diguanylate cyclase (GGDEF)-like protein